VLFLAAWLLGEPITTLQLIGTAIALAGVMVLGRQRR
jgi:drug/metabolite transporter (DMT)-like permease